MPDIEFLPESAGDGSVDENLADPRRSRRGRWIALVLTPACAIAIAVVATHGDSSRPTASAPPGPRASSPPGASLVDSGYRNLALGPDTNRPVVDVAVLDAATIWVLQQHALHLGVGRTGHPTAPFHDMSGMHLLPDPAGRRVWLLGPSFAIGYRLDGSVVSHLLPPRFSYAVALDDHLLLARGRDLLDITPGHAQARVLARAASPIASLAADPSRHRVLMADLSSRAHVYAVPLAGGAGPSAPVGLIKPTLAVAAGAIWVAGYDVGGGTLVRLDPLTLRPVLRSALGARFEPGAVLAAGGGSVLWVRDGGGTAELRCVDAGSGRLEQSWLLGGAVSSVAGTAVVGTVNGPARLHLDGCRG